MLTFPPSLPTVTMASHAFFPSKPSASNSSKVIDITRLPLFLPMDESDGFGGSEHYDLKALAGGSSTPLPSPASLHHCVCVLHLHLHPVFVFKLLCAKKSVLTHNTTQKREGGSSTCCNDIIAETSSRFPLKTHDIRESEVCRALSSKFGVVQAQRTSAHPLKTPQNTSTHLALSNIMRFEGVR